MIPLLCAAATAHHRQEHRREARRRVHDRAALQVTKSGKFKICLELIFKKSPSFHTKSGKVSNAQENNFPSVVISKGHTMQEKYTYGLWGAAVGAAALAIVGFSWGGWSTASGTAKQIEAAIQTAMIPGCVKDVMADPTAAAELKVKRPLDYDDIVRDYRKRANYLKEMTYQFNKDCGKAIEAVMAKMATKS